MSEGLISVIIPVYNAELTIGRCMDSVLNQTYKELEIILVESASTDRSAKICDGYVQQDNRVKVIHQKEKKGLSNARNVGLNAANGDYIGFVDSDDWMALDAYEVLIGLLKKEGADIACGQVLRIINEQQGKESGAIEMPSYRVYSKNEFAKRYFRISSNETVHYIWNKLYKAEIAKKIIFPEGMIAEDVEGFFHALLQADKIIDVNKTVYYYWYNQEGLSSEWFSEKQMDIAVVWKRIWEYCIHLKKEEWVYYAEMNYYRSFLGLLCRLMLSEKSSLFPKEKKFLIKNLKSHYWKLMRFPMPISRKAIMTAMCINYELVDRLYQGYKRLHKKFEVIK